MHSLNLVKLFLEQSSEPKAIIMAGGGGAGKSYILNQLDLSGIQVFNPDPYIEKQGLPLSVASNMTEKEVNQAVEKRESFIWDTTAGNPSKVQNIVESGYDVAMVMIYTHPIISLISNFERERSMPANTVLSTWNKSYSLIEDYKNMLGDSFYLIPNLRGGKYEKEIENFNRSARQGSRGIEQFLNNLISKDPEKYKSSFSKPFDLEGEQALQAYEKEVEGLDFDRDDEGMVKNLKKHFDTFWQKEKMPPSGSMEKKVAAIERTRQKSKDDAEEVGTSISKMLGDKNFQSMIAAGDDIQNVKSELQSFLKY